MRCDRSCLTAQSGFTANEYHPNRSRLAKALDASQQIIDHFPESLLARLALTRMPPVEPTVPTKMNRAICKSAQEVGRNFDHLALSLATGETLINCRNGFHRCHPLSSGPNGLAYQRRGFMVANWIAPPSPARCMRLLDSHPTVRSGTWQFVRVAAEPLSVKAQLLAQSCPARFARESPRFKLAWSLPNSVRAGAPTRSRQRHHRPLCTTMIQLPHAPAP